MDVLLTGATGLVGQHLLRRLLAEGDAVRVLALPDTVDRIPKHDRVELLVGDLSRPRVLAEAVEGMEVVYHLAARVLGAGTRDLISVNVLGMENLLAACARSVKRFVFISSVAVYAPAPDPDRWPITEDAPLQAHGSEHLQSYGQSKIEGEKKLLRYHHAHKLEYTIVRPPAVYGKEAPWLRQLVRRLQENPWPTLTPAAQAFRMHWVHVRDLAEGIILAGTRSEAANQVFNIAGPEVFTQATMVALLWLNWVGANDRCVEPLFEARFNGTDILKYDISKAHRRLGYVPKVRLEDGLREVTGGMEPPRRLATLRLAVDKMLDNRMVGRRARRL